MSVFLILSGLLAGLGGICVMQVVPKSWLTVLGGALIGLGGVAAGITGMSLLSITGH
jgi:hypothetical protein